MNGQAIYIILKNKEISKINFFCKFLSFEMIIENLPIQKKELELTTYFYFGYEIVSLLKKIIIDLNK